MSDLISRSALLKEFLNKLISRLEEEKEIIKEYEKYHYSVRLDKAIEIVNQLAEEYKGGWIPCSERLPEESLNSVIGWDEYRNRCCFVQYIGGRWVLGNDVDSVKIIAWQPLPAPYIPDAKLCASTECEYQSEEPCPAAAGCAGYETPVQTNAERIRSMSDEELATNMMCPNENGLAEIKCDRSDSCNCYECILKWLRSEVEE